MSETLESAGTFSEFRDADIQPADRGDDRVHLGIQALESLAHGRIRWLEAAVTMFETAVHRREENVSHIVKMTVDAGIELANSDVVENRASEYRQDSHRNRDDLSVVHCFQ
jgi:hypothetical protein